MSTPGWIDSASDKVPVSSSESCLKLESLFWLSVESPESDIFESSSKSSQLSGTSGTSTWLSGSVSRPWQPINPVPLCPIASTRLPPVPLYVPTFPDCLYFLCITTDRWALCPVRLPIRLLNMFPFTIPVTLCSRPIILTNTIRLRESATNITGLTHRAARAALVVGLPDSPSITPYILQ